MTARGIHRALRVARTIADLAGETRVGTDAVAAAVALREVAATFVFGVTTGDPLTYALAALAFAGVAVAAVTIPARRGSRIEPISALRFE